MAKIFVAYDEPSSATVLCEALGNLKHNVVKAPVNDDLTEAGLSKHSLVFICLNSPTAAELQFLRQFQDSQNQLPPLVVVTEEVDSDTIIETMRCGAFDHLIKPVSLSDLSQVIERALSFPQQHTSSKNDGVIQQEFFIGLSPVMREVQKRIGISSASDVTVLVSGETGSGKSAVAGSIHTHSARCSQPLTVVDCTAIPEDYESFGCLLPGSTGTVLLDEIGDLNSRMQALLVRSLKECPREHDSKEKSGIRVIATTQYDLISMVKEKRFREDLYYRLSVFPIHLPPLRDRGSDILALAETFLQQASPQSPKQLSTDAAKILLDYAWPGNVRELQNLMYHLSLSVRSSFIQAADLSIIASESAAESDELSTNDLNYNAAIAAVEKRLLTQALSKSNCNRTDAARILGINRQLLYAKLKEHKLGQ